MKLFIAVFALLTSGALAFHSSVKFNSSGSVCIILDAEATGVITYHDLEGEKKYEFAIGNISYTGGVCSGVTNKTTSESITIGFYPENITPSIAADPWNLTIVFKENTAQTNNAYKIAEYHLHAILYENIFPNATQQEIDFAQDSQAELEWFGEKKVGFSCSKSGLAFTNGSSIEFKNLKVIAFGLLESDQFPSNQAFEQCKLDLRTSDVVPIVVGACLAGLVIIVLIAYLIGRARAKRQGYASV